MPKRFTETQKWQDPWFRKLSAQAKLLWQYMLDQCDHIGLVELDFDLVSFDCKIKVTEAHVQELGDRVQRISDSRYFIGKFISFQYGKLSESCLPHRRVIDSIEMHGLVLNNSVFLYPADTLLIPLAKGNDTLKEKEEEKNKNKEKKKNKARATQDELNEFCRENDLYPRDAEYLWNRWEANGWKNGKDAIKDWKATIRSWKAAGYMPSQKNPSTSDTWPVEPTPTNEEEFDFLGRMLKGREVKRNEEPGEDYGTYSPSDL